MCIGGSSGDRNIDPLQSFHVVTEYFSDFLPDYYTEILDVTAQGRDVRVRLVRLSSATVYCDGEVLRAVERVLPNTTVREVAKRVDLCAYTGEGVASALKAAASKGISDPSDSATVTVVAKCGASEKILAFPYPVDVDFKILRRENPRIETLEPELRHSSTHLWQDFVVPRIVADGGKPIRRLGAKLLPELISGRYDAGFGSYSCGDKCTNYLAYRLDGYTEPVTTDDPSTVELVNASSLHLAKYESPHYLVVGKTAHIFGEVRLRIIADEQTGLVNDVQLVWGNSLLGKAAVEAAKKWQFAPGTKVGSLVEALLNSNSAPISSSWPCDRSP